MKSRALAGDKLEQANAMRRQGKTRAEVAAAFKCSLRTIERHCEPSGPYRGGRPKVMTEEMARRAVQMRLSGHTVTGVAVILGVSDATVTRRTQAAWRKPKRIGASPAGPAGLHLNTNPSHSQNGEGV